MSNRLLALGLALASAVNAQISLGSATNIGVFGSLTVSDTGLSSVTGGVAIWPEPKSLISGFASGSISGNVYGSNDSLATAIHADAENAYYAAQLLPSNMDMTGQNLGGLKLTEGHYRFDDVAGLDGILTLDGSSNDQWIFQMESDFTAEASAVVELVNGAQACNVFWFVAGSVTLGKETAFAGSIV